MARHDRDNFPSRVVRKCGERAAYFCTNPACHESTIGPHSDPQKSSKTGKACHIHAAAPGGPRYDPNQTPEERRSIENAIWLCSVCSDRVDKDETAYPVELLKQWKSEHEDWLRNGGIVPKIPFLALETLVGLSVPDTMGELDLAALSHFREHNLLIRNESASELTNLEFRVQTPEPIYCSELSYAPVGVAVSWSSDRLKMIATGSPGAKVTRTRPPLPSNVYLLQIERIGANQRVEIAFGTSRKVWEERGIDFDSGLWADMSTPPNTIFYLDGTYQFLYRGVYITRQVFAPICYSREDRKMSFLEVLAGHGDWKPGTLSSWS